MRAGGTNTYLAGRTFRDFAYITMLGRNSWFSRELEENSHLSHIDQDFTARQKRHP